MSQLLQEIRLQQAMKEKGVDWPYVIDHATPKTIVDGREYPLVFPCFLINADQRKDINMLFIGLITDKRREWLKQFPDAMIINSHRGRSDATRRYDKTYFDKMARARFVLCPDGDFVWTYRFFEAILCGAIPIIQNWCELYNGYYHFGNYPELTHLFTYDKGAVHHNLVKIKKEMMLQ